MTDLDKLIAAVEWRPIHGLEGRYAVSEFGHVLSHVRSAPALLAHVFCDKGYPMVHLSDGRGKTLTRKVHVLVARAFIGARPPGMEIRHLDGNKRNAHFHNLAYGSRRQNILDRKRHDLPKSYKLRPADVQAIKADLMRGRKAVAIAKEYGVHKSTIGDIKRGRRHADV